MSRSQLDDTLPANAGRRNAEPVPSVMAVKIASSKVAGSLGVAEELGDMRRCLRKFLGDITPKNFGRLSARLRRAPRPYPYLATSSRTFGATGRHV